MTALNCHPLKKTFVTNVSSYWHFCVAFLLNRSNLFHLDIHSIPTYKPKVSIAVAGVVIVIIDVTVPLSAAGPVFSHEEVCCTELPKNVTLQSYSCYRKGSKDIFTSDEGRYRLTVRSSDWAWSGLLARLSRCVSLANHDVDFKHCFVLLHWKCPTKCIGFNRTQED